MLPAGLQNFVGFGDAVAAVFKRYYNIGATKLYSGRGNRCQKIPDQRDEWKLSIKLHAPTTMMMGDRRAAASRYPICGCVLPCTVTVRMDFETAQSAPEGG